MSKYMTKAAEILGGAHIFFIIAGILAIISSTNGNECLIIGTLVVNIFSAVVGFIMVPVALVIKNDSGGQVVFLLVGVLEVVLAIISSALSFSSSWELVWCFSSKKSTDQV